MVTASIWSQFPTSIVRNIVNTINPKSVLSIGCGTGGVELEVGLAGRNVTGIDIYEPALDIAESKLDSLHLPCEEFVEKIWSLATELNNPKDPFFSKRLRPEEGYNTNPGDYDNHEVYSKSLPFFRKPNVNFEQGDINDNLSLLTSDKPDLVMANLLMFHIEENLTQVMGSILENLAVGSKFLFDVVYESNYNHDNTIFLDSKNNLSFEQGRTIDINEIFEPMGLVNDEVMGTQLGSQYFSHMVRMMRIPYYQPAGFSVVGYVLTKKEDTGQALKDVVELVCGK